MYSDEQSLYGWFSTHWTTWWLQCGTGMSDSYLLLRVIHVFRSAPLFITFGSNSGYESWLQYNIYVFFSPRFIPTDFQEVQVFQTQHRYAYTSLREVFPLTKKNPPQNFFWGVNFFSLILILLLPSFSLQPFSSFGLIKYSIPQLPGRQSVEVVSHFSFLLQIMETFGPGNLSAHRSVLTAFLNFFVSCVFTIPVLCIWLCSAKGKNFELLDINLKFENMNLCLYISIYNGTKYNI